ncbi:hypothetical protein F0562_020577 [Nyssa sinensis]|uniref:BTB domain-containing protein n=1 Tax=Nyssa sinensis TaxID=561372 RepID=A0A5J5BWK0_9ASTE|nr:hypothetical protein F0562_020577 [Nyssa sinensis]
MILGGGSGPKKRQRVGSNSRTPSTDAVIIGSSNPDGTPKEAPQQAVRTPPHRLIFTFSIRSKYFAALLSDRWQRDSGDIDPESPSKIYRLNLGVPATIGSIDHHLTVLRLLYTSDFSSAIDSAAAALSILPVALELLFEDCVTACVQFLEAVPWSEEEERRVLSLIPFLRDDESRELLVRVSPAKNDSCEEMLHGLILTAIHNHPNMAFAKAFVAKLLRDFSSRESAGRVLDRAFETSLKIVKESLEEYSSPDFRGDHNETEAIQRLNLHTAMTNGRHLLWLVERMIELRVADKAVKEWSNQASFTADLQRAFRDDAWRNIVPGLPAVVLRCTCKLANAVAAGTILAARQYLAAHRNGDEEGSKSDGLSNTCPARRKPSHICPILESGWGGKIIEAWRSPVSPKDIIINVHKITNTF